MGSGGCTNELEGCKLQSQKCLGNLDNASVLGKQKVAAEQPLKLITEKITSLGPNTPNADRENGDFILKKLLAVTCFNINTNADGSSPRTPVNGVFDPFAPGPDDLVLAPRCEKFVSKYSSVVVRQLNFDSPVHSSEDEMWTDVESISDEEIFEAVYENLLEAIVSKQTEGVFAVRSTEDWDSDDCKTPSPEPRPIATADSCPGAPMRPSGKSRDIDSSLIRKLEF